MYIIKNNIQKEYIIKKSKFICKIYQIENQDDAKNILNNLKDKYKDATHICYAYITKTNEKYEDDKEPTGTAGLPILDLLKKLNLTNVLAVVIRYYGGIKLGASGLIRAYKNSVKETITNETLMPYKEYIIKTVITTFENEKLLNSILKNSIIIEKKYTDKITYKVKIEKEYLNDINKQLSIKGVKLI